MINRLETKIFLISIFFTIIITTFFKNFFFQDFKNQFLLFLLPLIWPGLAHGSLDLKIAERIKLIKKKSDYLVFSLIYLILSLTLIYIWYHKPEIGMSIFLIISIIHFGMSDSLFNEKSLTYYFDVFLRGSIPISTPIFFYEKDVFKIFDFLFVSDNYISIILEIFKFNIISIILIIFIQIIIKKKEYLNSLFEILLIIFCFIFFEPLIAFSIYFCFLHSLRHLFTEKKKLNLSFPRIFFETLPITLITLFFLSFVYIFINLEVVAYKYITILFISLASLTIPHMILVSIEKTNNR